MWLVCFLDRSSCGWKAGFPLTPPSFVQRPPPYPTGWSSLLGQGSRHTGRVRKEKTRAKSEAEQSHVIMECGGSGLTDTTRMGAKARCHSFNPVCCIYTKLIPDVSPGRLETSNKVPNSTQSIPSLRLKAPKQTKIQAFSSCSFRRYFTMSPALSCYGYSCYSPK